MIKARAGPYNILIILRREHGRHGRICPSLLRAGKVRANCFWKIGGRGKREVLSTRLGEFLVIVLHCFLFFRIGGILMRIDAMAGSRTHCKHTCTHTTRMRSRRCYSVLHSGGEEIGAFLGVFWRRAIVECRPMIRVGSLLINVVGRAAGMCLVLSAGCRMRSLK